MPGDNGLVVTVLAGNGGRAGLDLDGDGQPNPAAKPQLEARMYLALDQGRDEARHPRVGKSGGDASDGGGHRRS